MNSNFKTGIEFAICFYIGTTIASIYIQPLGFTPYFILPFTLLVSNPIAWVMLGAVFVVISGLAISIAKPLFYLAQENRSRRNSDSSFDSSLGNKAFHENLPTLVHQTNNENYIYWLQQHDIPYIARIEYGYSENSESNVFFSIPGNVNDLNEKLKEYKNIIEHRNTTQPFTSVINLNGNHWVTLVIVYHSSHREFKAYYYDSFGDSLPVKVNEKIKDDIELANEITQHIVKPLSNEVDSTIREKENNPNNIQIKEKKDDLEQTLRHTSTYKSKLVNKQINTNYILGVLQETLKIGYNNIGGSKVKQQIDGCNCGIFALENAKKITDMLSKDRPFNEIDKELSKYQPSKKQLEEKRRYFTEKLMNDEEWKESLKNGCLGIYQEPSSNIATDRGNVFPYLNSEFYFIE